MVSWHFCFSRTSGWNNSQCISQNFRQMASEVRLKFSKFATNLAISLRSCQSNRWREFHAEFGKLRSSSQAKFASFGLVGLVIYLQMNLNKVKKFFLNLTFSRCLGLGNLTLASMKMSNSRVQLDISRESTAYGFIACSFITLKWNLQRDLFTQNYARQVIWRICQLK